MLLQLVAFALPLATYAEAPLPASLIRLPESVSSVFVAETATYRFHRYDRVEGNLVLAASYRMSIGQNGSGKEVNGDRRTPIGAYFVMEQLDTSRMHEKYGVTAYPLDYPNAWDLRRSRTGHGIWVHGVDPRGGERPPRDTDGCIALPNEDLLALDEHFIDGHTPVVITETLRFAEDGEREAVAVDLESAVTAWARSIADGDLYTFLSLYDDDFVHWGMQRDEWASFNLDAFNERHVSDVEIDDMLLLGYPGEEGIFLSRFRQTTTEGANEATLTKRIYWRRNEHGELKIIAEDSG